MAVSYLHTNTSSALVGTPSEVGNYLMQRAAGSTGPNISSGNMNASATLSAWFFSEVGDPGTAGAAGNFTVQLAFATQNVNIGVRVYLQRFNAAGAAQGTAVESGSGSQLASAATRIYSFTNPSLGTWTSGDRLGMRVQFTNVSGSMNQSCVLAVNTADAYTATPFTDPVAITPSSASHDHVASTPALTENAGGPDHNLTVASASHTHVTGSPSLTSIYGLTTSSASHTHTVTTPSLTEHEAGFGIPTGLTVTPTSTTTLDVSWDAMVSATGFDIERDSVLIATNYVGVLYEDTGLDPATEYSYRVRAVQAV
jgi:hypothetical protein